MIGILDKEIIEKFKEFQEKTGKHSELYIEDVEFENRNLNKAIDIFDNQRVALSSNERNKRKGKYPYYGASGIIDYVDDYIYDGKYLIISEDGENLRARKTPIAFFANGKFWVNNHAHVIRGKDNILFNEYLKYFIDSNKLYNYISFSSQPKLSQTNLKKIEIPLPKDLNKFYSSFQIQEAIVEFLEFWKGGYTDVIRDKVSKKKPIYEAIRRIVVQNTFKYDKFLVEKFEIFAKDRNYNLKLYEIMFDRVHITKYINMSRGKVISKKDLVQNGKYPVFSSQTKNNGLFGYIDDYMFDGDAITWTTDGKHAGTTFLRSGKFNYTNVCGLITVKDNNVLNIIYLSYMVNKIFPKYVDRTSKNSKLMTHHIEDIEIFLPTHKSYTSKEIQLLLVNFWEMIIKQIDDNLAIYQRMIELTDIIDRAFLYRTFSKIDWSKE